MNAVINVAKTIPMHFTNASGVAKTGLTVTGSARLAGSTTTASGTVTERTLGDYDAAITFPSVGTWFFTGTTTIDGLPGLWTETVDVITAAQNDPAASLTSVNVTLVSPVSTDATVITLVRGNDYLNADGRAVAFTVSSPSLVGATVTLRIYTYAGVTALSKTMTVSGTTVRADITSSETTALSLGTPAYKFTVTAVLADASTIRPASGTVWTTD